jgi:YgiT-type zinc finger domain-containing protein
VNAQGLAEGQDCPVCSLSGQLTLEVTSEADLVDGRTVVVHGVPTYVCDRCGVEFFDEATTRILEAFYEHAASDRARAFIVDFDTLSSRAAS